MDEEPGSRTKDSKGAPDGGFRTWTLQHASRRGALGGREDGDTSDRRQPQEDAAPREARSRRARSRSRKGSAPRHVSREASEPPDSEEVEDKEASEREASEVRSAAQSGAAELPAKAPHTVASGRALAAAQADNLRAVLAALVGAAAAHQGTWLVTPAGTKPGMKRRSVLPHSRCQRRCDIPVRDEVS